MNNNDSDSENVVNLGHMWQSGNGVGNPQDIGNVPQNAPTGFEMSMYGGPFHDTKSDMSIQATMFWALTFNLWKYTPITQSGDLGKPYKVFTCRTDPDTKLYSPKLLLWDGSILGTISPGLVPPAQPVDGDWSKDHWLTGPYLESVNIQMGFDNANQAVLKSNGPETSTQSGEVSTSISWAFNGGFFGSVVTGGLNISYSHTATMNLTDYIVRNDSDDSTTNHTIKMEMWGDGSLYNSDSPTPHPLTEKATSDMALAVAGAWELPGDFDGKLVFRPRITATYILLGKVMTHYFRSLPNGQMPNIPFDLAHQPLFRTSVIFEYPTEVDFSHTDPINLDPLLHQ